MKEHEELLGREKRKTSYIMTTHLPPFLTLGKAKKAVQRVVKHSLNENIKLNIDTRVMYYNILPAAKV